MNFVRHTRPKKNIAGKVAATAQSLREWFFTSEEDPWSDWTEYFGQIFGCRATQFLCSCHDAILEARQFTEEEAWRVTAFVLRQNGLWSDTTQLNESNAAGVEIPRGAFLTPIATPPQAEVPNGSGGNGWFVLIGVLLLFSALLFILKKSRNTTTI